MQIAFALYDEFTALDIIGPFQMLSAVGGVECLWVAEEPGAVSEHTRTTTLTAGHAFADVTEPDIVVVPGGVHTTAHYDGPVVEWLQAVHPSTTWTTSVCTGSLLLANAGLLNGLDATGHWAAMDELESLGARPSEQRVIMHHDERIITAAGVSSGIDMGLTLLAELQGEATAQAAQLALEYDPQPPFDAGSPRKAPQEIVDLVRGFLTANR